MRHGANAQPRHSHCLFPQDSWWIWFVHVCVRASVCVCVCAQVCVWGGCASLTYSSHSLSLNLSLSLDLSLSLSLSLALSLSLDLSSHPMAAAGAALPKPQPLAPSRLMLQTATGKSECLSSSLTASRLGAVMAPSTFTCCSPCITQATQTTALPSVSSPLPSCLFLPLPCTHKPLLFL